jgi:hypothetical protein
VRTVKTASGATAVQIVYAKRRGARRMEHVGSAHDERELEALKAAAAQRLVGGQQELELEVDAGAQPVPGPGPLPIVASRMGHLWEALCRAYQLLGFDQAASGDGVFRDLVLARIIEPTSKQDSLRVLGEVGVEAPAYGVVLIVMGPHRGLGAAAGEDRRRERRPLGRDRQAVVAAAFAIWSRVRPLMPEGRRNPEWPGDAATADNQPETPLEPLPIHDHHRVLPHIVSLRNQGEEDACRDKP